MDKPIIIETKKYEDFRGWLSVPLDKEIDFHVVQINQGYSRRSSRCEVCIIRKVNTVRPSWYPVYMGAYLMWLWIFDREKLMVMRMEKFCLLKIRGRCTFREDLLMVT